MAIIFTYPEKSNPVDDDLVLISDSEDSNKTKQVTISDIKGATASGVSQIIAGTNITISPITGTGVVTINSSGGGGGTPGGSDTQMQYNNGGSFGGTTGLTWDDSTNILSIATRYEGDINGAVLQQVLVKEPGGVSKGDVVYISGGTGDNPEVRKAQANSISTMAALGIMKNNTNVDAIGECVTSGEITGLNLTGFTTGDELFVSNTTAGGLLTSAPASEANLIQKIGKVIKGGSGGALTVLGAFRTNATPNLNQGSIFIGNGSNQASTLAIGTNTHVLTSNGTTASWQAIPASGVTSFTNAFGTYITGTANTSATGAVTVGTIDLNAVDGTAIASTRFLSKDNTWDIPNYTVYNAASASTLGLMKLISDTEQTVAANAVTTESGRTYGVQFNADDQAVVNVPWTDTATSPSSPTNSVQFNSGSGFGGSINLTFSTDTLTLSDTLEIKGDGLNPGILKLYCENVSTPHAVSILGPVHSGATAYEIRLPNVAPSNNQILESNGSGQLSWINTPSGGGGGFPGSVSSVTSNVSLLVNNLYTVTTSSGTPDIEVTLPTAVGNSAEVIGVKYAAQNDINDTVVIKTVSSQTIDGVNRTTNGLPLASLYTYFELVSDGANWFIK